MLERLCTPNDIIFWVRFLNDSSSTMNNYSLWARLTEPEKASQSSLWINVTTRPGFYSVRVRQSVVTKFGTYFWCPSMIMRLLSKAADISFQIPWSYKVPQEHWAMILLTFSSLCLITCGGGYGGGFEDQTNPR